MTSEVIKKSVLRYHIDDKLSLDYGYKLRGFFANNFEDVLFHHHKADGELKYSYPLIQYKITYGKPTIVGLNSGAETLSDVFLDIDELSLGEKVFKEPKGKIEMLKEEIISSENEIYRYRFITPWVSLNQSNYEEYREIKDDEEELELFLSKILIGNILAFAKGIDCWIDSTIKIYDIQLEDIEVKLKGKNMVGFNGSFSSNIKIPEFIGLGKSTSRGYGTIIMENQEE